MCGRYSLALRPSEVRAYLEDDNFPAAEAPDDEGEGAPRQSYNFAPGYYGIVYRAETSDHGAGTRVHEKGVGESGEQSEEEAREEAGEDKVRYKLQSMRWGLIPFWTKRNPDYGSMMKTINCRDDSLIENKGMWTTMKQRKRCVVVAQGFYEWLKKGKEKIPHYVKRKDGKLMCFAGLWDCVQYEGSDEKNYTYTIITTSPNKQLSFLHDRMPVILENGSEEIRTWLDPKRLTWSKDLQSLLRPFQGELEIYPVSKEVGKVGNNSPTFIVPVASSQNKSNIANFFSKGNQITHEPGENRKTVDQDTTEDNAPLPVPEAETKRGIKREMEDAPAEQSPVKKMPKHSSSASKASSPPSPPRGKTRSATSNDKASPKKSKTTDRGSQKITNFFGK